MLEKLKNFDADRLQLDELVALAAFGRSLQVEYTDLGLEAPEYVNDAVKSLRREINARNRDRIEARKREVQSRLDSLKTPAEKKKELKSELAQLEKQLA